MRSLFVESLAEKTKTGLESGTINWTGDGGREFRAL